MKFFTLVFLTFSFPILAQHLPQDSLLKQVSTFPWSDIHFIEDENLPEYREVILEDFDTESYWQAELSSDFGIASTQYMEVSNKFITEESKTVSKNLGVKINFYHRGAQYLIIKAQREIKIPTRGVNVRINVLSRNKDSELYLLIRDYYGKLNFLKMGKLNFNGWRTLIVFLPYSKPSEKEVLAQDDKHLLYQPGLSIVGFRVDFTNIEETQGNYYLYFDNLIATVNNSLESSMALIEDKKEERVAALKILDIIKSRISKNLIYPPTARANNEEGFINLGFTVASDGMLSSLAILSSSKIPILDAAALEVLKSVFPVENDYKKNISMQVQISYKLKP